MPPLHLAASNGALSIHQQRRSLHRCRPPFSSRNAYAKGPRAPSSALVNPEAPTTTTTTGTGFQRMHVLANGSRLLIRPLTESELDDTTDLLVETYFRTYNLQPYKRYLMSQVRKYCMDHMHLAPDAVLLVALLTEPDASHDGSHTAAPATSWDADSSSGASSSSSSSSSSNSSNSSGRIRHVLPSTATPPSQGGADTSTRGNGGQPLPRLVGVAEVSFTQSARSPYPSLNPPPESAFLTNMAVDERVRRCGIGTQLLQAAEDLTALSNRPDLFLHVRLQDGPARRLYAKHGFRLVEEDCVIVSLFGRDRKQLLCKFLDEE